MSVRKLSDVYAYSDALHFMSDRSLETRRYPRAIPEADPQTFEMSLDADWCRFGTRKVEASKMLRILCVIVAAGLVMSLPADAASKKTKNAAAVGAGVGLVTGGVSGAAKGAVIGGGAGAYANAEKGDKAKKKAKKGAAIGAGVGLVTDGVSGAAKGAVYGGAAGAMYGEHKDKKK